MRFFGRYLFTFLAVIACVAGRAQTQDLSRHNWYFGNSTSSMRFDRTTNAAELIAKSLPIPFGIGGPGVATDHTNRNLLFYTDGANIFDVTGQLMTNGAGLGGASATNQPVALCPAPGQANQFHVFTRDAAGTVTRSVVDMNQFGNSPFPAPPTGAVTLRNQPVGTGLTNRSEAMLLVPSPLDTAYWLITHQRNSNLYTVTRISQFFGISNVSVASLGFTITAANFSYHAGTGRIAVSPVEADANIAILNFNNATGALTFNQFLFNTSVPTTTSEPATYDTEWSLNGRFLYLSRTGDTGVEPDLLQFDLTNPSNTLDTIMTSPAMTRSWGIQLAPDSAIYHLYQEGASFFMGRLNDVDSVAASTRYATQAFPGNINFAAKQFPAFAPKARITLIVSFVEEGVCSNTNTTFFPTVLTAADSLVWDFGDGNSSNQWSPVHTYTSGGAFDVSVRAFLKGDTASFTKTININQFDLQLSLVQDTTACCCELPFPKTPNCGASCGQFQVTVSVSGGTAAAIQWFGPGGILPTQTTATLSPDSAGYYYVVVTDAAGCSTYAGVNIREYGLQDQRANIWYFGNRAGIDFNNGTVPISNTVMNAPEGCSIICDRNGQAIFFTDGNSVWDRQFNLLETGIGGDLNATQSVLIMPVQGDETLYYIFTTQEIFGSGTFELRYSLFDLKVNNGVGDVVQKAIPLFSRSTERITGNGNWVVAHEFGNNSFRAYRVSAQGISAPVISSVGSDHQLTVQQNGEGYMKLGAQNRLAVALSTPGVSNMVEVFDFADSTGVVSNLRTADLTTTSGQVYGVEFSPAGNKLFATLRGTPSQVHEFAFDSLANPYFKGVIGNSGNQLGAIQIAPDGQIYVASQNQGALGTINAVEDTTQLSTFTDNSFPLLGGTNSRLGLPNFIQQLSNPLQGPGISVSGVCFGAPTDMVGSGTDPIDDLSWRFLQLPSNTLVGQATGDSTSFTFPAPGDYLISLDITNRCGLDTTISRQITIFAPPADPTFLPAGVPQPVLCTGSLLLEATPASNPDLADLSFLWTTGDTTRTIIVNRQSIVGVTITDVNGCFSSGNILVADNRPQVELGPDLTICQNTPIAPLDAQNPGTTYNWTVNGGSSSTTQTRSVVTTAPGVFKYKVDVLDPITTCEVSDSVTFTINPIPVFTATPFNAMGCNTADGRIELNITSAGSFTYGITGPVSVGPILNQPGPSGIINNTGLPSGSYGVTVNDELSGCSTATVVGIGNAAITVTLATNDNCDPMNIDVTHNVGAILPFSYRVLNSSLAVVETGVSLTRLTPFSTGTLASNNTYVVEITRTSDNCVSTSQPITLTQGPQVSLTGFTSSCGANGATIVTVSSPDSPPLTFDWSASQVGSINGSTTGTSVTLNPGTWNLLVTVDNATLCPATGPFTATGTAPFTASFGPFDSCQDQISLDALPTGNFTYLWTRNGVSFTAGQSVLINAPENATYGVIARSAISGCTSTASTPVIVIGDLQATLSSTPPCEGTPFTLTATSTLPSATFSWSFNGTTINGATTATLQDTRDGLYAVTVTQSVCSDTEQIQITNAPITQGQLNDEYLICNDPANPDINTRQVLLNPGTGFIQFQWYQDGSLLSGETNQTYTATEPGNYEVDLVNVFGCVSEDRTILFLECDPRIVAPTAFRPGSSISTNSSFFVYSYFIDAEDFQVFIFNRWGEMVYQSNDRDFRWNGGYNGGSLLPAGTYTYVVKYKSSFRPEDGVQEKRGGVVLVR
jgi:gliding motility-associated-like protein